MKAPESLETLVEYGIIQDVLRPLMSGKEAQVFVVLAGGEECVAKVYKEATQRTFKHRTVYTEGRRTRNTRDQRAMSKRSQHGRKKDEEAWRSTEVDMIYRLRDAGVCVPEPINFVEGVLVMELVKDGEGHPAPRLGDLSYTPEEARTIYHALMREVVRMLCAGVIHGDLSEFNVLMTEAGPVVIDFPQAVDPTQNPNSKKLLLRDVANLDRFLARFAPEEPTASYGEEIWALYEANRLRPDTKLRGVHEKPTGKVDTTEVMALIEDAERDNRRRHADWDDEEEDGPRGHAHASTESALSPFPSPSPSLSPSPLRRVVDFSQDRAKKSAGRKPAARKRGARKPDARSTAPARDESRTHRKARGTRGADASPPPRKRVPPSGPAAKSTDGANPDSAPAKRRRRRSARDGSGPKSEAGGATSRRARSSREGEGPKPPAGPRGAKSAAGSTASEKPARGRKRRSRAKPQPRTESTDEAGPAKRRGASRASSKRDRPSGDTTAETRPKRGRRRRLPRSSSTR